jgi:uncharacterized membrane protein YagU involved in acid resistance
VAGTVDIFAASLITLLSPLLIMRFIAAGLLGREVIQGGFDISFIGLLLQWLMGLIIATIYVLAARRLAWMERDWRLTGLAYGVVVYFVMNYVVLPLSALHRVPPFEWKGFILNMMAMLVFGLIIAWFTHRSRLRAA